ncbi:MAG: CdaR family protein [Anaerococcus sp.]|nr:CdaR family protein [Anaerococcus sp.]
MKKKSDLQLIILSILLAIVMWTFVTTTSNPSVSRTFRNQPLLVKNKETLEDKGYTAIGLDELASISVTLEGSRDNIVGLKQNDIQASIDIGDVGEGIQSVDVNVDTPNGVRVDATDPSEININVQKIVEKTLPINIVLLDSLKEGRSVEVNEQSLEEITVRGPYSQINKIDRAEVIIDNEEFLDGKIHNHDIRLVAKNGEDLGEIEKSADDINLSFIVSETKSVSIKLNIVGDPASGYHISSRSLSPKELVIKGSSKILKDIKEIETKPININNLRADKSGEVGLDLADGVEIYDGKEAVTYRIVIERDD